MSILHSFIATTIMCGELLGQPAAAFCPFSFLWLSLLLPSTAPHAPRLCLLSLLLLLSLQANSTRVKSLFSARRMTFTGPSKDFMRSGRRHTLSHHSQQQQQPCTFSEGQQRSQHHSTQWVDHQTQNSVGACFSSLLVDTPPCCGEHFLFPALLLLQQLTAADSSNNKQNDLLLSLVIFCFCSGLLFVVLWVVFLLLPSSLFLLSWQALLLVVGRVPCCWQLAQCAQVNSSFCLVAVMAQLSAASTSSRRQSRLLLLL